MILIEIFKQKVIKIFLVINLYKKDNYHTFKKKFLKNTKIFIIFQNKKEKDQDKEMKKRKKKNGGDLNKFCLIYFY